MLYEIFSLDDNWKYGYGAKCWGYFQKLFKSSWGPRLMFIVGPKGSEKRGGVWVCVRRFIVY
jgi:hypothetical protein